MLHGDALQSAPVELQGGAPRPQDGEAIDFEAILRFGRKRFRLWLAWLLLGVLLGIGYAALSPPAYTVTAAILLKDPTPRMGGDVAIAQSEGAHSTYIDTQIQVFASNEIIGRVVDMLSLIDDPEFGRNAVDLRTWLTGQVHSMLRSSPTPEHDPRFETVVRVRRALALYRVGMSDVIEIQFTSRDPNRAAELASAVIRVYALSRLAEQESARTAAAERDWKRLEELRDKAFPAAPPDRTASSGVAPGPEARALFLEEQQKTDTYRLLYGSLLQRALGYADSDLPLPNLRVITPPTPLPLASSRLIGIVTFIGLGGIFGLVHALLREATDDTLRTADDVRRADEVGRVVVVSRLSPRAFGTGSIPQLYEVMGKLAVALMERSGCTERWMIGVTSSADGTGASLVAGQLARVIAETGKSTCLVDATWRLPPPDLAGRPPTLNGEFARSKETLRLSNRTLDVLTLRSAVAVSDLLGSRSVISALEEVSTSYACIIVDLHSPFTTMDLEATIGRLDDIIVVVEANRSKAEALRHILQLIPFRKRAAVVLNKTPDRQTRRVAERVTKLIAFRTSS